MALGNYDTKELADNLILQIKNLIDGNQASADEIKQYTYQAQEFSASLYIQWRFYANTEKTFVAGGNIAEQHFGYDLSNFERSCQVLFDKARYDVTLRRDFLNHLQQIDRKALNEAEYQHLFHDFGSFSVCQECNSCRGRGKTSCTSCSGKGKTRCNMCNGSGSLSRQEAQYRHNGEYAGSRTISYSCHSCCGSGSCTCSSCSGSGKVRCKNCNGHGFFTLTRHIKAVATPSYDVSVSTDYEPEMLIELLRESGTKFCGEKIPFYLSNHKANGDDTHLFSYKGESIALSQDFTLRHNKYHCCAFSNPPYPYVRPKIFDDLFADEVAYLESHTSKSGKVSKKNAITFFNRYAGQPVLDEAMRIIAKTRTETKEGTGSAVFSACHGFISQSMSEKLAKYLNHIMDKVSPTYASFLWWFIGIICAVFTFLLVEDYVETRFQSQPIDSILSPVLTSIVIFLIGIIVSFIFSVLYVLFARRKIPPEYRQKMRHKEPIKRFMQVGVACYLVASIYGYSATKHWVPKTHGIPLQIVQSQWDKQIQNIRQHLPNINWLNFNYKSQSHKIKKLSQTDKAKAIQKKLSLNGYKLSVDGKFGGKSIRAANKYLKKQNISLPNNATLDNYYDAIVKD